jgi:hypothetical protein
MSPTRRKRTRRKTARKTAGTRVSQQETILKRAGLLSKSRMTGLIRDKVRDLTVAECKALASAKKKTGYPGSMHIRGFFF